MILPLLAGFFAFLLFFFRVMQVQTGVQTALYCAGRKTAVEAGTVDSSSALFVLAEGHFQKELRKYPCVDAFVAGGRPGVTLLGSDLSGEFVELNTNYYIKSPLNLFGKRGIYISQGAKTRKWRGDGQAGEDEDYVYVTEHGTVYHRSRDCHYLDLSIRAVNARELSALRNKDGHIYYACEECAKDGIKSGLVYITDYGTRGHNSLSCGGLKRTIYLVPLIKTGGKAPCSKCGQEK